MSPSILKGLERFKLWSLAKCLFIGIKKWSIWAGTKKPFTMEGFFRNSIRPSLSDSLIFDGLWILGLICKLQILCHDGAQLYSHDCAFWLISKMKVLSWQIPWLNEVDDYKGMISKVQPQIRFYFEYIYKTSTAEELISIWDVYSLMSFISVASIE